MHRRVGLGMVSDNLINIATCLRKLGPESGRVVGANGTERTAPTGGRSDLLRPTLARRETSFLPSDSAHPVVRSSTVQQQTHQGLSG
jgi:hypothetical protein